MARAKKLTALVLALVLMLPWTGTWTAPALAEAVSELVEAEVEEMGEFDLSEPAPDADADAVVSAPEEGEDIPLEEGGEEGGGEDEENVDEEPEEELRGVFLNAPYVRLCVREKYSLSPIVGPAEDMARLHMESSDPDVAKVSSSGLVKAISPGEALITAMLDEEPMATCMVYVRERPNRLELNEEKMTLNVGETFQLAQTTLDEEFASRLRWTSSDEKVATVESDGTVCAVGWGSCRITVRTPWGLKASCKVSVPFMRGKLIYEENTESLRVHIYNDNGIYLTHIWVEDASRQLFKNYGDNIPERILQSAVSKAGLKDKLVVGFNASPPVNKDYYDKWNRLSDYHHREPSPLIIQNGKVLVKDLKTSVGLYLYWIDGGGWLRYSTKKLSSLTEASRKKLYKKIIASGARQTMIWRPVLVKNYSATTLSDTFLKQEAKPQRKQALCQRDAHNFIIVSSGSQKSSAITYPDFQQYLVSLGVRTAVELDAGGSTSLILKGREDSKARAVVGGGRRLTMVMYFTELD